MVCFLADGSVGRRESFRAILWVTFGHDPLNLQELRKERKERKRHATMPQNEPAPSNRHTFPHRPWYNYMTLTEEDTSLYRWNKMPKYSRCVGNREGFHLAWYVPSRELTAAEGLKSPLISLPPPL